MKTSILKSILLIPLFLIFIVHKSNAQLELGFRYMPTFSNFHVNTVDRGRIEGSFTYSNGFGGLLGVNFTDNFALQTEVIYSVNAQRYKEQDYDREIKLNY